ncbi:MAG: ribonuclease G [Gammaproteobacteria bacterium]|nr:ribonuclease G [Gammaproteobacteria bacterium]
MSTEILVNIGPQETRVALVEGGVAQEIFVQRAARHGLVGNVYKGSVARVLPGMQAAFIDVGLERTGFLHVTDMLRQTESPPPPVDQLLREGQEVLVQVLKDPIGSKGARLTTLLSIPSRYLVLLPHENNLGVSAKIGDEAERERLRGMLERLMPELAPRWGVIARTAADGADEVSLTNDLRFLTRLWLAVEEQARFARPGQLVHGDLPLSMRILRDLLGTDVERIRIDSADECRRVKQFAQVFLPQAADKIEPYTGSAPIFDLYGVEDELNRALARKVELKSGGHLVIDQTEALTTIDVNTGTFTGHRNLEETIFKTNLEAAQTIARQLRLRNLGGMIVIDFIDMNDQDHRVQVLRTLEKECARGSARTRVHSFTPLGLVEMTRKRTRESLGHILCEPCPGCGGRGVLKTVETVCHEIAREVQRAARQFEAKAFLVLAAAEVTGRLREQSGGLAELEALLGRPIRVQAESLYQREDFDVVPL